MRHTAGERQARVGDYILSHTLGEGTTGKVKLGIHKDTGVRVAVKMISKESFAENADLQMKVSREIALMKVVNHPNILKLIDVLESQRHLYIVLEYAEQGELFDYLVSHRYLEPPVAINFFRQIVYALEYLHNLGICHRDLKPENILLDSCTRVKLADFGFARWVSSGIAETSCGSPHYAAPEIIRGHPYDGKVADIWSLGVILYALCAGFLPFDDPSIRNLLNKVKRGVFVMPSFPPEIQDLIRRMLTVDVDKRITLEGIKAHPAFRNSLDSCYVIPVPIPFSEFSLPIDPTQLPSNIIDILNQIGFADPDELKAQLETTEHSMAKVFISIITGSLDLEALPWAASCSGPPKPLVDTSLINSSVGVRTPEAVGVPGNMFHRTEKMPPSGASVDPSSLSFANRPEWALDEVPVSEVIESVRFDTYGRPVSSLMVQIQVLFGTMPVQWFHPDPLLMYVRSQDGRIYISLVAEYRTSDDVSLKVLLHKGDVEDFVQLATRISLTIQ